MKTVTSLAQLSPFGKLVFQMLVAPLLRLEQLGDEAIKQKAPFAIANNLDPKLVGDVEAELAVQNVCRSWALSNNHCVKWISEELPDDMFGPEGGGHILVAADGFDGTENLNDEENAQFSAGTMVSVSLGHNPRYSDVVAGGCLMFRERWILIADKHAECVILYNFETNEIHQIDGFEAGAPDPDMFLIDPYPNRLDAFLADAVKKAHPRTRSTAATIVLLAGQGKIPWESPFLGMNLPYTALIADATDKRDLEQLVLYLVMDMLGGMMITFEGNSPAQNYFLEWGDHIGKQIFFMLVPDITHYEYVVEYLGAKK